MSFKVFFVQTAQKTDLLITFIPLLKMGRFKASFVDKDQPIMNQKRNFEKE
jgi:hypothetical protein